MTRRRGAAISLTGLAWIGALALVLAGLVLAAWHYEPQIESWLGGERPLSRQASAVARRTIVYRLDDKAATTFRFSQPVMLVRLSYQPVLEEHALAPGVQKAYAIHADLLDSEGGIVARHEIWSSAMLFDIDGRRRGPYRFFRGSDVSPGLIALGDEARIASSMPVAAVRLTSGKADPGVLAIHARVYERRPLLDQAAESAFYRLSPDEQETLAGSSAFPPSMLTREERIALARNQWRPVGPEGIEGRDYRMGVLYENAPDTLAEAGK